MACAMIGSMLEKVLHRQWCPLLKVLDNDPGQTKPLWVLEVNHVHLLVPHPAVPHVHPLVGLAPVTSLLQCGG